MDVSAREHWKVGAFARELGQARELGEYWRCFESGGRTSMRTVGGVFLLILGLFAGVPSVVIAGGLRRAVVLIVTCGLVSAGVALIRSAPNRVDRILLYARGLAQLRYTDAEPRVIHWSRLGQVVKSYSSATEDSDPQLMRISVTGADGTVIVADQAYGWGSVRQLEQEIVLAVEHPDARALVSDAGTAVLSSAEVSQALGWPMRAVPCPTIGKAVCARFEGGGAAVEVKLRRSVRADRAVARRVAQSLPGIGDEAWLLNTQTRLVVRVGTTTALLTITDLPPPARAPTLIHLARIVAARLVASPAP